MKLLFIIIFILVILWISRTPRCPKCGSKMEEIPIPSGLNPEFILKCTNCKKTTNASKD